MTNFHQIPGGLEMFGEGMMPMDFVMSEGAGFPMNNLDAQMCEVEVPASMQDVTGDEEGLLMRTAGQPSGSDSFFSSMGSSAPSSGMLFSSNSEFTDSAQWIDHPQPSPFNAISAPLRNMRGVQGHQSHSSTSSTSSGFGDEYSAASLSAPSHKQSFDHSVLYPPGMMDSVGPMRRHRSMTPSLIRNGEPIRRPMTSNSNEFPGTSGSPASLSSSIGSSRGYHPYAYSGSNSRANSTHNSPRVQPVPLGPDYAPIRRSDSRSSNYSTNGLNDQMRQMMSMDPSSSMVETMFRSDSPASFHQTESPAAFNMDLPLQYSATGPFMPSQPQPLHASTMPVQYPQQQQQQQQFEGYYTQPHATL
ncbi:unnamed protein product [Cyclocybe aegerita]|uniref:Uncharacterized protein n=1 Tax=Cyclocybe aegerita TaxID=1973307 RepID=A0A8S0VVM1_CYCAE|nr:unnamed protein product [Cyclocybe aegerita]